MRGELEYAESGVYLGQLIITLPLTSCQPPLSDVIAKRFISYVQRCLTSDCDIVNYVVQYGI